MSFYPMQFQVNELVKVVQESEEWSYPEQANYAGRELYVAMAWSNYSVRGTAGPAYMLSPFLMPADGWTALSIMLGRECIMLNFRWREHLLQKITPVTPFTSFNDWESEAKVIDNANKRRDEMLANIFS